MTHHREEIVVIIEEPKPVPKEAPVVYDLAEIIAEKRRLLQPDEFEEISDVEPEDSIFGLKPPPEIG